MIGAVNVAVGVLFTPVFFLGFEFRSDRTALIMICAWGVYGLLLCISGICIMMSRCWLFSVVIPMGTTIGGYTLYVICNSKGRGLYAEGRNAAK